MNVDDDDERGLENLLSKADRPAPATPADLAARVRQRDHRRRRRRARRIAAVVLVLFVGVTTVIAALRPRPMDAPPPVVAIDHRRALGELTARIRDKRDAIDALLAAQQQAELTRQIGDYAAQSPDLALDADRDRAAGALLEYAAEMSKRTGGAPEARNEYRRVIELFPDSPLALAAREGLKDIEH